MFRSDLFRGDLFRGDSSIYQSSYNLACKMLRGVLRESAQAGSSAEEGIGSLRCRASGALYSLLMTHPIDERGRCRACRRPRRVLMLPRQRCRVQGEASYWLRQPEWFLYFRVDGEWELGQQEPPDAAPLPENGPHPADPDDTDVVPRVEREPGNMPIRTRQTPSAANLLEVFGCWSWVHLADEGGTFGGSGVAPGRPR